jgi:NAD(P)-dependent dehydrogenase (short-subunit alcohol dehydrogenase family)
MSEQRRVALVTGGTRGIGFEVCRQLAGQGLRIIVSGRDEIKARQAADRVRAEGQDVASHPLDVTDAESIGRLRQFIIEQFGRLDVLVNNAGISIDESRGLGSILDAPAVPILHETLATNLDGPLRMCQAFIPMMRKAGYGRVVNVSSELGSLSRMGSGYQTYRISKAALNALTRILAAELRGTNILVNSAHPGWVRTDMGGPRAPLSPEQGAETIVRLATLPDGGPTGGFFHAEHDLEW